MASEIDKLRQELADLKYEFETYKRDVETWITQLDRRIARLEDGGFGRGSGRPPWRCEGQLPV